MIRSKNYEKLSKFVKVMAKILAVLFSGHGIIRWAVNCSMSVVSHMERTSGRQLKGASLPTRWD